MTLHTLNDDDYFAVVTQPFMEDFSIPYVCHSSRYNVLTNDCCSEIHINSYLKVHMFAYYPLAELYFKAFQQYIY